MTEHGPRPSPGAPEAFDQELSVKGITWFVVATTAVTVLAFVFIWSLAVDAKLHLISKDPAPSPMPEANRPRPRPGIALQDDPNGDMARYLEKEKAHLAGYGWVDRSAGVARIPLERAIDLVAEQGLPKVAPPATPAAAASAAPERK